MQSTVPSRRLPLRLPLDAPVPPGSPPPAHPLFSELAMVKARLELAAEAADTGLWSIALDDYTLWTNRKVRDIFRLPRTGKVAFDQFVDRIHPDDRAMIREGVRGLTRQGDSLHYECRLLDADGSVRWIVLRGALHRCTEGKTACLMGALADITSRKLTEETTARQLRFEALMADISASFARILLPDDVDHHIEQALEQLLDYFGGDRSGLIAVDLDSRTTRITHAHYREGLERIPADADLATMFPWAFDTLTKGECYCFSSLDEVPPEAATDRRTWTAMGVTSLLHLPLPVNETSCYLLVISSLTKTIAWPQGIFSRLRMLGDLFVSLLCRKKAEEELRESHREIARLKERLEMEADYLRAEMRASQSHEEIIGQSEAIRRVLGMVGQVGPTDSTVLVWGETGTGKELIAQALHNESPRRDRLLVKVNCASLPSSLVESELFGRERGAYTGALTRQIGRFELADGSTLFLDEISELSLELQAKLLRVLQEGEFERLGSPKTVKVDVRVIAATNKNLLDEVRKGKFREDLYYRLNVFPIFVPPLRERLEDIPMLVWEFVRQFNDKMGKKIHRITKRDMATLQSCSWPGNIRELRNVIEYAAIVSTGDELKVPPPQSTGDDHSPRLTLEEMECRYIEETLKQTGWRIKGGNGAASILGINPATLYSRMKKLGITPPRGKDGMSS